MIKLNRFLVIGAFAFAALPAFATPVALDGTWYNFAWDGAADLGCGTGVVCDYTSAVPFYYDPGLPPWTFDATGGAMLTVQDGGELGDRYHVFDMGALIGTTSTVDLATYAPGTYVCGGGSPPGGDYPLDCVGDPNISHGSFLLAPGSHSITLSIASTPYENSYLAWFKVDAVEAGSVPEPKTAILLGAGLIALGMLRIRRPAPGRR